MNKSERDVSLVPSGNSNNSNNSNNNNNSNHSHHKVEGAPLAPNNGASEQPAHAKKERGEDVVLKRERELRGAAQSISRQLEELKSENQKLSATFKRDEHKQVSAEIGKLHRQVAELDSQIADLGENPKSLAQNMEQQLETLKAEIKTFVEQRERYMVEKKLLEEKLLDLKTRVSDLKKKLPYTSIMDYDREISRLNEKLNTRDAKAKHTQQEIQTRITELEKSKTQYQEYYEMWEMYVTEQKRYKQATESLDAILLDLKNKLAQQEDYKNSLKQLKESKPIDDIVTLKQKREKLVQQLTELKERKAKLQGEFEVAHRDLHDKQHELKTKIDHEKRRKQQIVQEMDQLKQLIVSHKLSFNPDSYNALLGKQGKTMERIRSQSKAEISISVSMATITIRGNKEDADLAKQEIERILNKITIVENVRIKPAIVDVIDMSYFRELKQKTGVNSIFLDRVEGIIRIVGHNQKEVNLAKVALDQLIEECTPVTITVPVPATVMPIIFAHSSAYLSRLREKTGVSRINVHKEEGIMELEGSKKRVDAAKRTIEQLVKDASQAYYETKVEREVMGAIIGRNGSRIAKMEQKTGAYINVDKNTMLLTVRGTHKAVELAKRELSLFVPALKNFQPKVELAPSEKLPMPQKQQMPKREQRVRQQQMNHPAAVEEVQHRMNHPAVEQQPSIEQQASLVAPATVIPQEQQLKAESVQSDLVPETQKQTRKTNNTNQRVRRDVQLKEEAVCYKVIGPRGETVIGISKETKTQIDVNKRTKIAYIYGAVKGVEAAEKKVQAIVDAHFAQQQPSKDASPSQTQ